MLVGVVVPLLRANSLLHPFPADPALTELVRVVGLLAAPERVFLHDVVEVDFEERARSRTVASPSASSLRQPLVFVLFPFDAGGLLVVVLVRASCLSFSLL